jgi:hypothetical protein
MAEDWKQKLKKKIEQADIPDGKYTVSFSKPSPGPNPIGDYKPDMKPIGGSGANT